MLPSLGTDGPARVWSVDSIADALALTVAGQHSGGSRRCVEAFAPMPAEHYQPLRFSRADLRGLPELVYRQAFHRSDPGWAAVPELTTRIRLGVPGAGVDLISARTPASVAAAAAEVGSLLKPGGNVVVLEPGLLPPALQGWLEAVDGSGRLLRRCRGGSGAAVADDPTETLAEAEWRAELVERYANLARALARRFGGHGEPRQDLDQVAFLGLLLAARRFDSGRDTSFSTFATTTILGELKRYFRDKTWMMRVPRSIQETYLAVKQARETLSHELSASPTVAQIATRIGISEEKVLEAIEAGHNYWPESLDVGVHEDDPVREIPVTDGSLDRALERHDLIKLIPRLSDREQLLLRRLYFEGCSQRAVADELGVSQMQVSRLLARTIANLRAWSA